MAAGPIVNWYYPKTRGKLDTLDGSCLAGGSRVALTSSGHRERPYSYAIYRILPKPFWKFWGTDRIEETKLAAKAAGQSDSLGGRYRSDGTWRLPDPSREAGVAEFRAWTDTGDASSGRLLSASMELVELAKHLDLDMEAGASFSHTTLVLGPKVKFGFGRKKEYRVKMPKDPWVEVSLLQAEQVLTHLQSLEEEYVNYAESSGANNSMHNLPGDALSYFVDRPLADSSSLTCRLDPENPIDVTINIPDNETLRAVFALQVRNLEDGSAAISPPVFVTHVRDQLVLTDLTIGMLRDEPLRLLLRLDEVGLNVSRVAEWHGFDLETTWSHLVAAAEELGADSVEEAAFFVSQGVPMTA